VYSVQLVATAGKDPRDQDITAAEFYLDGVKVASVPCKAGDTATHTLQVAGDVEVSVGVCFVDDANNRGPMATLPLDLKAPGAPAGFRIASVTFVP
jgi:hypothetical protein